MGRENYSNFATTALVTTSLNTSVKTFTVTTSQGALFPTGNFYITMDVEVMLISARSGDTFTVASNGRGYDGTTAATHAAGAIVQNSVCRGNLNHIWQNVSDTYHPEVPPFQLGGSPSTYDNEFEAAGSWTLSPSAQGTTTFSVNSDVSSHLVMNRSTNDNTVYTAYTAFTPGSSAFTVTVKLATSTSFVHANTTDESQVFLFVSDQSNPASGADTGKRFRIDTCCVATINLDGVSQPTRYVRVATDTAGTYSQISYRYPFPIGSPMYLRMTNDGSGNWVAFIGDGNVYSQIGNISSFTMSIATLGLTFTAFIPSGLSMAQTCLVDYVRVNVGSVLPPFAN